jgi:hypothetical protein
MFTLGYCLVCEGWLADFTFRLQVINMLDSCLHLNQKSKLKNRTKSNQTSFEVHIKFNLI